MGRKIFVSYKYGDTQVEDLEIYNDNIFGRYKVVTKARDYVDKLADILDEEDHIYKGEDDGQSLKEFSDEQIASKLRDKIYDSSITIVIISRGMKDPFLHESDQWIPWEISYSLRESTRNDRTKRCNGILAVTLPDQWGSYEYFITTSAACNCRIFKTPFLFKILRSNMFNQKNPSTSTCVDGTIVYHGNYSYIHSVRWDDFERDPNSYIEKTSALQDSNSDYYITKSID